MKRIKYILFTWFICLQLPIVSMAAGQLKSIEFEQITSQQKKMLLHFDKPIGNNIRAFTLEKPYGIVFDLESVEVNNDLEDIDVAWLRTYDIVKDSDRTRLVLRPHEEWKYSLKPKGNRVEVLFESQGGRQTFSQAVTRLRKIDFEAENNRGKTTIALNQSGVDVDIKRTGEKIYLSFNQSYAPKKLWKRLDVTDFGSPVQYIETHSKPNQALVTISAKEPFEYFAYQNDKNFILDVQPVRGVAYGNLYGTEAKYRGKPITLNFQDIKVRSVIQMIAEFTGINIVVSDTVVGNMTLRLNAIPWDQALDIILTTQGLAKRQLGDVMLIAPSNEIASREANELKNRKEVSELAPIRSELIIINYAKADEIAKLLKDQGNRLLSAKGNVGVDPRTNHLWVQDTAENLAEIRDLIKKLDIPIKQVEIEARVVNVTDNVGRDLGIRWGVSSPNTLSGSLEGANNLKVNAGSPQNVAVGQRLNVDFGASNTLGTTAKVGVALAKLGNNVLLDLELSALESEERIDIISTPRLVTSDKNPASIESGEDLPFQQATSSGATAVTFKKAVLKLEVTPHITPDKRIIMDLTINNDLKARDGKFGPEITTNAIKTQVLVNNGETIVLGGIYKATNENKMQRVPFLSQIPFVGNLFKNSHKVDNKKELIIFLTPRIIQQSTS